jgi:hypothetical protein
MTTSHPRFGPGIHPKGSWRPSPAHRAPWVPGACDVVLVRAWHLTDATESRRC